MLSAIAILRIARSWWTDKATANLMTAIALAESGGNPRAKGDNIRDLGARWDRFQSDGWLSFGLWQIFLGVHTPMLQTMSGLHTADQLAEWLFDPDNNARAAAAILANQGFSAWSVFNVDAHTRYLPDVEAAGELLDAKLPQPPQEPASEPLSGFPFPLTGLITGTDGKTYRVTVE